jgi:hypothetical protein
MGSAGVSLRSRGAGHGTASDAEAAVGASDPSPRGEVCDDAIQLRIRAFEGNGILDPIKHHDAWKDYRDGGKDKLMTVAAEESLRAGRLTESNAPYFLMSSSPSGVGFEGYIVTLKGSHPSRNCFPSSSATLSERTGTS